MDYVEAYERIIALKQPQILDFWQQLRPLSQNKLLKQIGALNVKGFRQQQSQLLEKPTSTNHIEPFRDFSVSGNQEDFNHGKKVIAEGRAACLILAGGQGTRLQADGPKGLFPATPIKRKPIFQVFGEKIAAASKQAGRPLHFAFLTSPFNVTQTKKFFHDHRYFGMDPAYVSFVVQKTLPLLDPLGNLFLEDQDLIAEGPDGNGHALKYLVESGVWEKWQKAGVTCVNTILIDNLLADPFDAELIGFHDREDLEITMKCTDKKYPRERVGHVVRSEGTITVLEYSEFPDVLRSLTEPDGTYTHRCANLSLFCFSMDFINRIHSVVLPLHRSFKVAKCLDSKGISRMPERANCWKYETYIFDLVPMAQKVKALLYPREQCFAPLKNAGGDDSIVQVREALLLEARRIAEKITGLPAPYYPFELSADFFYPTEALLQRWKGKPFPDISYIEDKEYTEKDLGNHDDYRRIEDRIRMRP